jgi:hypothetical protein
MLNVSLDVAEKLKWQELGLEQTNRSVSIYQPVLYLCNYLISMHSGDSFSMVCMHIFRGFFLHGF